MAYDKNVYFEDFLKTKQNISWDMYCNEKINVEFILSLGAACRPAHSLRANKLRYFSSPFDWMMRYSLESIEDILKNGIDDYFKNFEVIGKTATKHVIRDKKTGMVSMHFFDLNQSVEDQYDHFITVMKKRFNRTIQALSHSKILCFVSNRNNELKNIFDFVKFITGMYKKDCFYINITDDKHEKIEMYKICNSSIFDIWFDDAHALGRDPKINNKSWFGNVEKWKQVMKPFILTPIEDIVEDNNELKKIQ